MPSHHSDSEDFIPLRGSSQEAELKPAANKRKRFHPDQLSHLISIFETTTTPSFDVREELAKKLGMTNREVQVWFQNRRAKINRQKSNPMPRFLHHPSMNVNPLPKESQPPRTMLSSCFHFVPVVVSGKAAAEDTSFKLPPLPKRTNRKPAPAPIKVMDYPVESSFPKTAPVISCRDKSPYSWGHHRHYSYHGIPRSATLPYTSMASPISPDLLTPGSAISFDVHPEMVSLKAKSSSTTTLPSLRELGLVHASAFTTPYPSQSCNL
ncbi:hypothetical protein DSO57_1000509 [Entomophthora muscae]|uniref:Uncharacterized protein n=1 Tax=Entomophthora muscae TaxID=34485 RepID=A0ACC2RP49_9FUNG|nr:hypothetical protein DSO57_1000509 [Entomophthora muscae]